MEKTMKHNTPLKVGDYLVHSEHGEGWVAWINSNPNAKLPIKIHFREKAMFLMIGLDLKEYPDMPFNKFVSIMQYK